MTKQKKHNELARYDYLEEICDFVKIFIKTRKSKKLTQQELAKRMDVTQASIARFESGDCNPTLVFLLKLSEVLGLMMTIDEL